MSKDDYFVLAYKLLRYLYRCLKEGTPGELGHHCPQYRELPGIAAVLHLPDFPPAGRRLYRGDCGDEGDWSPGAV